MSDTYFGLADGVPTSSDETNMDKVLSASSYPQVARGVASGHNAMREQLFGGIVLEAESAEEDEDDDHSPPPKKRSRTSKKESAGRTEASQEPQKRQRGRPKVITRDETAAERRRTQIRLAQRAYRNRKENTITELTQKVDELQGTLKDLHEGVSILRQNLLSTGIVHTNSTVARQVNDLMQKLSDVLDTPSDAEKTTEDEEGTGENHKSYHNQDLDTVGRAVNDLATYNNPLLTSNGPVLSRQSDIFAVDAEHDMLDLNGHDVFLDQNKPEAQDNCTSYFTFTPDTLPTNSLQPIKSGQLVMPNLERFPFKQTYTYSFQETTFARRLHRLCIERAFRKILSPSVDPNWLLRTFRFTFTFSNKDRIINAFKSILSRGIDESLENWRTPFIHIGGAGLHFPRYDADGNPVYPPNLLSPLKATTPWRAPHVASPSSADTLEGILESVGFGGEWFDSHDVEEYLKTKGIYPQPQSSFVMVDKSLLSLPPLTKLGPAGTVTTVSSPRSSQSGSRAHPQDRQQILDASNNATTAPNPLSELDAEPYDAVNNWLSHNDFLEAEFGGETNNMVPEKSERMVTIEIEKFLERLAEESVCLGRAPGFRRDLVDNALSMAVQEAF